MYPKDGIFVVLIIFGGAKKLPELASSLGKALQEFKKGIKNVQETKDETVDEIIDKKRIVNFSY